ncbi:hypothetical protein [Paracoccus yeei]|uniref:hypothetical protein n=1 Tax=Paracoccus yeei TaxID=147645 RepID=UPI001C8D4ADE|nr:hypothetical protein [Paracoccus yeei]MBY0136817.1 hypothetical protein [Paracoccus yeei]
MTLYVLEDTLLGGIAISNIPPTDEFYYEVPDGTEPDQIYIKNDDVKFYPPKPDGDNITFDYDSESWIDARTKQDWDNELQARRMAASMSRLDFVLKCHAFGILNDEEAEIAADGGFPDVMQGIIDSMPQEERFEAKMRWKMATVIDRMNPLIISMAAAIYIDEWSLDKVFGVIWPDPISDTTGWVEDSEGFGWHP